MLNRGDTPPHSTPADRLLICGTSGERVRARNMELNGRPDTNGNEGRNGTATEGLLQPGEPYGSRGVRATGRTGTNTNQQTTQNNNLGHIKNPTYSRMRLRDRGPPAFTLGWARRAAPQTVELLDLCSTDTVNPERCPRTLVPRYSQGHATTLRRYGGQT